MPKKQEGRTTRKQVKFGAGWGINQEREKERPRLRQKGKVIYLLYALNKGSLMAWKKTIN